ncbi:hypothetical protein F964_01921 [Acinetobacter guillouiae NIPH 991]|uniref:Uncharacterized protein n=1 Tax=Acinetobacter guillouiae NIPH 991 TaxID=1217656 RepID=N8YC82_ACIGI|nr:hypothetical protein F964_01921 [Acinetobacter guillouiae NIPH 991]
MTYSIGIDDLCKSNDALLLKLYQSVFVQGSKRVLD